MRLEALAWLLALSSACGEAGSPDPQDGGSTASATGEVASSSTSAASSTSGDAETTTAAPQCGTLYGRPNENTGLGPEQCGPACPCLDGWDAPVYTESDIEALDALELTTQIEPLPADPYATPAPDTAPEGTVCGVLVDGDAYALQSYADEAAAEAAGAQVTHGGLCGQCSPLQDLAVYMRYPDLTQPVRECGLIGLSDGEDAQLQCLLDLGFTAPCAQIWGFNTTHTRTVCLQTCLSLLDAPYHEADGSLNACLQCDEDMSGPVFKAFAGRTRRNTGLASALCRPCDEVRRLLHRY